MSPLSLCRHNKTLLPANYLKSLISQLANSCNKNTPTSPQLPSMDLIQHFPFLDWPHYHDGWFIIWLCAPIPLRGGHPGSASHLSLVQLTWELVHKTMSLSQRPSEKERKIGQLALPREEQTLMGGSYITIPGQIVVFTLYPWPVWFLVLTTIWGLMTWLGIRMTPLPPYVDVGSSGMPARRICPTGMCLTRISSTWSWTSSLCGPGPWGLTGCSSGPTPCPRRSTAYRA
jgi:hypothetical protein